MTSPQIFVLAALELGPNGAPTGPDFTDLSDRVLAYRDQRGRTDVLREFQPGSATVVLDNGDRMLDPSNPDGLVYAPDGKGLPLCPVVIGVVWDGNEYPKFCGFLGPEAWPGDTAPHGPSGTVTLNVVDALGHSPDLPDDLWGIVTASLQPDWWLRMDEQEFPVLDDLSEIPNSVGDGHATVSGTTGISRPQTLVQSSLVNIGVGIPGLLLSGDHSFSSPAADIMPNGDEADLTVQLWWSARDPIPSGEVSIVAQMLEPITGTPRWSIVVDGDDGYAYITTYDAAGDVYDTDSILPLVSPRWDNASGSGAVHQVVARWDAGDAAFTVWFGGVSEAITIPGDLEVSDLVHGPNPADTFYDEIAVWRRSLSYRSEFAIGMLLGGGRGLWNGDTWADRLGRWVEATGRAVTYDDTGEWHLPADATKGLWGLVRPRQPTADDPAMSDGALPETLADAFQMTVASGGGARWVTKEGYLRARTIHALEDPTYAAHYADPVHFTDADTALATSEYRHAGVEVTGLRIDRVINRASVDYVYASGVDDITGPDIEVAQPMTNRAIDTASKDRYGIRAFTFESAWADWPLVQQIVDLMVSRYAQPHQEIERIHLDPNGTGDDATSLAEWLIADCELEKAVDVTYTPADADPVTVEGLNIQHIAWDWTPERWTVDLMVAAS